MPSLLRPDEKSGLAMTQSTTKKLFKYSFPFTKTLSQNVSPIQFFTIFIGIEHVLLVILCKIMPA